MGTVTTAGCRVLLTLIPSADNAGASHTNLLIHLRAVGCEVKNMTSSSGRIGDRISDRTAKHIGCRSVGKIRLNPSGKYPTRLCLAFLFP